MICTTPECGTPTAGTYLCTQCVSDLQAWIDRIPEMREELFVTMARLDCVAPRNTEGGGGGSTEAPTPLNERAMDMRHALLIWEGQDASQLANDQYAGGFLSMLQDMLDKAERIIDLPTQRIVYGPCQAPTPDGECEQQLKAKPEAEAIDCPNCGATHQVADIIKSRTERTRGKPLPPREVREHLAKNAKTHVSKKDIENWVMHKKLKYVYDRVTTTAKPQRVYFPGDVLKTYHSMKDRKRVA